MQILIADDDPVYRTLLQSLLQEWRFDVSTASDGAAALAMLTQSGAPRLAILDWMMPGMDGFEVCRRLRQRDGRNPYILLMTGNSQREELLTIILAGADDYLLKPFEPLDLKIRLRLAVRVIGLEDDSEFTSPNRELQSHLSTMCSTLGESNE